MLISNVVKQEQLRNVQLETLKFLSDAVRNSYGPIGSNTEIFRPDALNKYTKDGHSILEDIQFRGEIERAVQRDITDITRHVVKTVGDGTTSASMLAYDIFKSLIDTEKSGEYTAYEIIANLKNAVKNIKEEILSNAKEFTSQSAYDITYISTNGNAEIANTMKNIYERFGNDVFIDVAISNTPDSMIKIYDGMTLPKGYCDSVYINNAKNGTCEIRNPKIYTFEDPIDTPEMFSFFNTIISNNIFAAYQSQQSGQAPIPTVIIAPHISRDSISYMDQLNEFLCKFNGDMLSAKPPILIITNADHLDQLSDISKMCGCKSIKKYINPQMQEKDVEAGLAPNLETILDFCGTADEVVADLSATKFVNPKMMNNSDGTRSEFFKAHVEFLESELGKAKENSEDIHVIGTLKRRINSLKANMVEYLIGGISMSDRDSVRDLVEDAVLNCRSAAQNGVGFGASVQGYLATLKLYNDRKAQISDSNDKSTEAESVMLTTILSAYKNLLLSLYSTKFNQTKCDDILDKISELKVPYNIKTEEYDEKVLCSITTDSTILEAVCQIVSIMFTCNQFLCSTINENKYLRSE